MFFSNWEKASTLTHDWDLKHQVKPIISLNYGPWALSSISCWFRACLFHPNTRTERKLGWLHVLSGEPLKGKSRWRTVGTERWAASLWSSTSCRRNAKSRAAPYRRGGTMCFSGQAYENLYLKFGNAAD